MEVRHGIILTVICFLLQNKLISVDCNEINNLNNSTNDIPGTIGVYYRTCKNVTFEKGQYRLLSNGTTLLVFNQTFTKFEINSSDGSVRVCYRFEQYFQHCTAYCLPNSDQYFLYHKSDESETFLLEKETFTFGEYYDNGSWICICNVTFDSERGMPQIWPFAVTIPCVMLFVAFVATLTHSSTEKNGNRCQINHLGSLFLAYFMLALCNFTFSKLTTFDCVTIAVLTHWSYIAAFSWLNALGVDIYMKFARFPSYVETERHFVMYSIYAWTVPTVVAAVALTVDQFDTESIYCPQFKAACWFNTGNSLLVFYYVPLSCILFINIVLFVVTVYHLHRIGKSIAIANRKIHRQLWTVYLQLFFVMGIAWIVDVICWSISDANQLQILDVINEAFKFQLAIFVSLIYISTRDDCKFLTRFFRFCLARRQTANDVEKDTRKSSEKRTSELALSEMETSG